MMPTTTCHAHLCPMKLAEVSSPPFSLSCSLKDVDSRVQSLRDTCSRLPRDSYNNLRCFVGRGFLDPTQPLGAAVCFPNARSLPSHLLLRPHRYLIKFLAKLAEHQEVNKMTPSNIAIVLGPNLLWPQPSTG